jgi:predicted alpha-1,2-mannosidase
VKIEGGTKDQSTAFTTALYHAFLQPGVAGDVSGAFMGFDGQVHQASGYTRYADFSGWDIYRAWIQLAAVLAPAETSDMMQSLVAAAGECGALPKWAIESTEAGVMVGDPADVILANAYAFGARGFDAQAALTAMVKGATDPTATCGAYPERQGLADYLALQYCPVDGAGAPWGPPATTLEYALADFAVARLAGALGDSATEERFLARGGYWKNVFDPNLTANGFTGYMQPRMSQDQGGEPAFQVVDVTQNVGFVEGNATQYTFVVPHDLPGLFAALGGDTVAVARLDSLFTQLNAGVSAPYCYIGNEPSFGLPWAYPFAGAPWRTQDVVRRILTTTFDTTPSGLPGNDDLGAMSAWQAWAMLGLYPAIPGVGGFVLGSPTFSKATITLASGNTLVITAEGGAPDAPYVQSLTLNGVPSTSTWVAYDSVSGGGTLAFALGNQPNTSWGAGTGDRPPAFYP